MFTGIIREIGQVTDVKKRADGGSTFAVSYRKIAPKIGDSICVQGACLTVVKLIKKGGQKIFYADVIQETLKRTNLKDIRLRSAVNLEASLKASDRLDGGFVLGHVDAVGQIFRIEKSKNGVYLFVRFPQALSPFIAEKGSVTINGVNLTVTSLKQGIFSVALIPFTLRETTLGEVQEGDGVNLEVDILARYVYNMKRI